jgi:hypothetical protein
MPSCVYYRQLPDTNLDIRLHIEGILLGTPLFAQKFRQKRKNSGL